MLLLVAGCLMWVVRLAAALVLFSVITDPTIIRTKIQINLVDLRIKRTPLHFLRHASLLLWKIIDILPIEILKVADPATTM